MTHRSIGEIGEPHVAVLKALRSRDPSVPKPRSAGIEEPGEWIREAVRKEELKAEEQRAAASHAVGTHCFRRPISPKAL
jgi:hypothetical protein